MSEYKLHTILINNKIGIKNSNDWILKHGYKIPRKGVRETKNYYRYRQISPETLIKHGYTKPKTINIVACDGVTVCSYINNVICGKFTTKTLTPHPPGGRGCSYIFCLKKEFGVAHEEK